MKKTYIAPSMEVTRTAATTLLVGSKIFGSTNGNDGFEQTGKNNFDDEEW